jgi:hypothetical protein
MDTLARKFPAIDETVLSEAEQLIGGLKGKSPTEKFSPANNPSGKDVLNAKLYVNIMKRVISKGSSYVTKETVRLTRVLEGTGVKKDKQDLFMRRLNVLGAFLSEVDVSV